MLPISIETLTTLHVVISLVAILAGIIVVLGMLGGRALNGMTFFFLATTILTSVTGFLFPYTAFGPSHWVGVISLAALVLAVLGLYVFKLAGRWRWIYIATAVLSLYLNVFVGVVQAFQKLPFLQPLAPTQTEPAFLIAQSAVLALFAILGFVAVRSYRPAETA